MTTQVRATMPSKVMSSDEPAPAWYENDLQLAAALGMKLLERNRDLQEKIRVQEATIQEQNHDIVYITERHAEILHNLNNSHSQTLEQLESNVQELENECLKLRNEKNSYQRRIQNLRENIEFWQQQCQSLQEKIDQMAKTEPTGNETSEPKTEPITEVEESYTHSPRSSTPVQLVINLTDDTNSQLETTIRELELQCKQEQRRCENLQLEVTHVSKEKQLLEDQLSAMQQEFRFAKNLSAEIQEMEPETRYCSSCKSRSNLLQNQHSLENECEVEDPLIQSGIPVFMKLKNGGQAYGNRESLSSEDSTSDNEDMLSQQLPTKRRSLLSELLNHSNIDEVINGNESFGTQTPDLSIAETDLTNFAESTLNLSKSSFYVNLFQNIAVADAENLNKPQASTLIQTNKAFHSSLAEDFDLEPLENPFSNHFQKTPEYKSLFQQIFNVLKRSVGGLTITPKKEMIPLNSFRK